MYFFILYPHTVSYETTYTAHILFVSHFLPFSPSFELISLLKYRIIYLLVFSLSLLNYFHSLHPGSYIFLFSFSFSLSLSLSLTPISLPLTSFKLFSLITYRLIHLSFFLFRYLSFLLFVLVMLLLTVHLCLLCCLSVFLLTGFCSPPHSSLSSCNKHKNRRVLDTKSGTYQRKKETGTR